jgi:uncharacterized protein (TIGR02145 family)
MSLITRGEKGEKLTIEEMDGNLLYLEELAQTANSGAVEVAYDLTTAVPYKAYRAKITAAEIDWPGYGFLYNWFAVNSIKGLANPDGGTIGPNLWRVPSNNDWNTLINYTEAESDSATTLKSSINSNGFTTYGWLNNGGGNDIYNFSALPGGLRYVGGGFDLIGLVARWWSSNGNSEGASIYEVNRNGFTNGTSNSGIGLSVRLVREATEEELFLNDGDTSDTAELPIYLGNDGTEYSTVKIGTQVWLAQNLRETLYSTSTKNNDDPIFNASVLLGGDSSSSTWIQKSNTQEGAWCVYDIGIESTETGPYLSERVELIYSDVSENTLGQPIKWESILDRAKPIYYAKLLSEREWYPTHIQVTPGYDTFSYDENQEIIQRNLIVKRAVAGEEEITFFPIRVSGDGGISIEGFGNYTGSSNDSGVNVEILEYQPIGSGSSGVGGLGISLLD